jgi:hypothetical protein
MIWCPTEGGRASCAEQGRENKVSDHFWTQTARLFSTTSTIKLRLMANLGLLVSLPHITFPRPHFASPA